MTGAKRQVYESDFVDFIYQKGDTGIYNEMQFHSHCEIYLFLSGKVEFINKNIKQTLLPNQLVIILPGIYHKFHVLDEVENYERCIINIHPDFIDERILEQAVEGKNILTLLSSDRIVKNMKYLIECYSKVTKEDFDKILSCVATDIVYAIKYSQNTTKETKSKELSFLEELMIYIDNNFEKDLNLKSLASRFNYSVSHISHAFKTNFGISIKNYILQKRLMSAYAEIHKGEKAQNISLKYGFSNYSTFYKLYKKNFGVSPSEHKKHLKNK